jgi:hypothetical protein
VTTPTHITISGGLISAAFIDNTRSDKKEKRSGIRELDSRQPGTEPEPFSLPWADPPRSPLPSRTTSPPPGTLSHTSSNLVNLTIRPFAPSTRKVLACPTSYTMKGQNLPLVTLRNPTYTYQHKSLGAFWSPRLCAGRV